MNGSKSRYVDPNRLSVHGVDCEEGGGDQGGARSKVQGTPRRG